MQALARVGIAEHALKRGSELSGGQQQRAAIARTLVQGASVLIADEPIASLDPKAARRVMDILAELNRQDKITVLVSLHQVEYALVLLPAHDCAARRPHRLRRAVRAPSTPAFLSELYGAESEELFLPGASEPRQPNSPTGMRTPSAIARAASGTARRLRRRAPEPRRPALLSRATAR